MKHLFNIKTVFGILIALLLWTSNVNAQNTCTEQEKTELLQQIKGSDSKRILISMISTIEPHIVSFFYTASNIEDAQKRWPLFKKWAINFFDEELKTIPYTEQLHVQSYFDCTLESLKNTLIIDFKAAKKAEKEKSLSEKYQELIQKNKRLEEENRRLKGEQK
jgi:cell division protein FtsB